MCSLNEDYKTALIQIEIQPDNDQNVQFDGTRLKFLLKCCTDRPIFHLYVFLFKIALLKN